MVVATRNYGRMLRQLVPPGRIWPRGLGSVLQRLLDGLGDELARVDCRVQDYLVETDPLRTNELLPEWERMLGLPDPCAPPPESVAARRRAVVARLQELGGQTPAFFIGVAQTLGFSVTVEEHYPFRVDVNAVGYPVYGDDWAHAFTIHSPLETIEDFAVGLNAVGDPLRSWGNEALECGIERNVPAHAVVRFAYDLVPNAPAVQLGLTILDENNQPTTVLLDGQDQLVVLDENAQPVAVPTTAGQLVVLDEQNNPQAVDLGEEAS